MAITQSLNYLIDHTNLSSNASLTEIEVLCKEAQLYHFNSICIRPEHIKRMAAEFKCSAVIGFPQNKVFVSNSIEALQKLAQTFIQKQSKDNIQEFKQALLDGALELDPVINPKYLLEELPIKTNPAFVELCSYIDLLFENEYEICKANPKVEFNGIFIKPIWSCELLTDKQIKYSVEIMAELGRYIKAQLANKTLNFDIKIAYKNSTGFIKIKDTNQNLATPELIRTIANYLSYFERESLIQIKAAGGVQEYSQALDLITASKGRLSHIGTSSGLKFCNPA